VPCPEVEFARFRLVLQHVTLEVRGDQVSDCVAFWELLGFRQMTPPPLLRDRFTWVEREDTQIHLVPVDEPVPAREGHVAIVAADYEGTLSRLVDGGFELREGSNAWDAARSFVRDPAGHLVEVMSKPPQPPWPGE
jgi:catechol 2,3-dioxygenase-like lactoylglutathione lyase family enzyme